MSSEITVAMQIGRKAPKIARDVDPKDIPGLVEKERPDLAAQIEIAHRRLDLIARDMLTDPDLAVEYFQLKQREASRDELLANDLANYTGEGLTKRIEQYHAYTDVGSALLYKDSNFRGRTKFFTLTWPNFKWWPYCCNDEASSAKAWGGNILFEHTWYRGRRLDLIGIPYFEASSFSELDFNDIASSFVSIP